MPAAADESDLPGAQEPGQPPQGGRLHVRAVEVRVHQHVHARSGPAAYERYHVPASGRILWDSVLANLEPGHQGTWVDYKNDARAPLLFISGTEDHLMPPRDPAVQRQALQVEHDHRDQGVRRQPHLLPSPDGWEEVADYALDWALEHARPGSRVRRRLTAAPDARVRITHIGGPTVLIEFGGWRILSDPTFDPPGRRYDFGCGTAFARSCADRRCAPRTWVRSTWSCSATTTTGTTSTTAGRALLPVGRASS